MGEDQEKAGPKGVDEQNQSSTVQKPNSAKKVESSSSESESDTDSDTETVSKSTNVIKHLPPKSNVTNKVESSSDSSTSSDEHSVEDQKIETKVVNVKVASVTSSVSASKSKRKRKRKNKNKNKLPLDQIPVFTAEIETVAGPVHRNVDGNNSHVRFDAEEETMEVDNNEGQEFTEEDIKKLYAQSVATNTKTTSNNSHSVKKTNTSRDVSCEDVLIKQFDNKTVTNAGVVKKSSNLMFTPRVLSVNEMKVKSTRKEPLHFTNGHEPSNGVQQEEKKDDKSSAFAALLNCNGKVFDKNEEPIKDYTSYHLVSDSGPRVGDIIAFKHVEMGENYAPEVSEYKEGKVLECDGTNSVTFELVSRRKSLKRAGKFELDEDQTVQEDKIQTFNWCDLIEPRLVFP